MLGGGVAEALRALGRISAVHPVLRAARVLDAGACALLVVLDALARAVGDERPVHVPLDWLPDDRRAPRVRWSRPAVRTRSCCWSATTDAATARSSTPAPSSGGAWAALGDSVAVVGGDGWWHVHVHTDEPTAAIAAAALGRREQVLVRLLAGAHAGGSALHDRADGRERWGVVVCTARAGPRRLVRGGGCGRRWSAAPRRPIRAEHLERAVTDTGAARVVLLPGTGAEVSTALSVPGVVIETLDAADEVRAVVGSLALAGEGPTAQGCSAAQAALARLGVAHRRGRVASQAVADAVDALVRTPRATPAESLTVLGRDAPDGELLDALVAHLAAHHPGDRGDGRRTDGARSRPRARAGLTVATSRRGIRYEDSVHTHVDPLDERGARQARRG